MIENNIARTSTVTPDDVVAKVGNQRLNDASLTSFMILKLSELSTKFQPTKLLYLF